MLRTALLILSGNSLGSLLGLLRSVVVARLISVEDFGIAATFTLSLAIVEMISALGLQQQIIQHEDGDKPYFQTASQGLQVMRALPASALLFLLAEPIAGFFGIPQVSWAFRLMALAPLLNGLGHMDPYRVKRKMRYGPYIAMTVTAMLISLLMVWPLSRLFGDYRVMLFAVLGQSLATLVISHLVAKRPYRWSFNGAVTRTSLQFGWPILLNAILLFMVFNGERVIVGRELGMASLALFSMAFTLVLSPTLVMEGSAQSFFLPQLSAARGDAVKFAHLAMTTLQCHLMFGAVILLGVALLGGPIVHLLLGAKYAAAVPLLTWLAVMQGVRVAKGGSATATLALAFTENGLVASVMRVALLPIAWYITATGGKLEYVIWLGTLGELFGYIAGLLLARYRLQMSLRPLLPMIAATTLMFLVGALHAYGQSDPQQSHLSPLWTEAALIILFGLVILTATDLRHYLKRSVMTVEG